MSRIGKKPIEIPNSVEVKINKDELNNFVVDFAAKENGGTGSISSGFQNVVSIELIEAIILDSSDSMCSFYCEMDMNGDNEYNVVDIILIINIIINL